MKTQLDKTGRMPERNAVVDIYKGIGIILMMMGHIGFGGFVDHTIHAFHMPMFFFVSGFLFKEIADRNLKGILLRKTQSLLVPYFLFGLGHYLLWMVFPVFRQGEVNLNPLWHLLWENTTKLPIAGALWFLTALLWTNVIFLLLRKKIENDKELTIWIVLLVTAAHLCLKILPFRLPWALDAGIIGMGFFLAGYLLQKKKEHKVISHLLHMPLWQLLPAGIVCLVLILVNDDVNMRTGQYACAELFWVNALAASVLLFVLAGYLQKWEEKVKLLAVVNVLLKEIGAHAITYVCLNQIVLLVWQMLLSRFETEDNTLVKLVIRCTVLVLSVGTIEFAEKYLKISKVTNIRIKGKELGR